MREACESTFIGKSNASLLTMYKAEHSPTRTQLFWVTLKNIKLFVSTHLLRHHVGSIPFQLSCRDDRKGGNPGMTDKCTAIVRKLRCLGAESNLDVINSVLQECANEIDWLSSNADRNTKVTLSILVNAQSLIDMAKLRLCNCAHTETRKVFAEIKNEIAKIDPDLASMMVRKCVYRGGLCGEMRCCGFNSTFGFKKEMELYVNHFSKVQRGLLA